MKNRLLIYAALFGLAPPLALAECALYSMSDYVQGVRLDGTPIPQENSDPRAVRGGDPDGHYFSLGFDPHGEHVIDLQVSYVSGSITVWDDTIEDTCWEAAQVYVGLGPNWVYLGTADNNYGDGGAYYGSEFDFDFNDEPFFFVNKVKIVDITDPSSNPPCPGNADAFDLDAICLDGTPLFVPLEAEEVPSTCALYQNYPNPFNPSTTIRFRLEETEQVGLQILDLRGEVRERLVDGLMDKGEHNIVFDGSKLSSGMYFYVLRVRDQLVTRKMVLLK